MALLNMKMLKEAFLKALDPKDFLAKDMKMKGYWAEYKTLD